MQNIGVDRDSSERTINVEPVLLLEDARRASTMLKWTVVTKPETFRKRIVGSDPRAATCRGKLQSRRSKLNMEINKELRLRNGAENLYRATTDPKTRENVSLELRFVNSNLQLLKEQLAELNSSVELYQATEQVPVMPMIPLGLKETNELELRGSLEEFISQHYHEPGGEYEEAVAELMDLRQAVRTPSRDGHGIALLFQYYNQLHFLERRFFSPDRQSALHFEWYDSLTGVPCTQKTVAFEKASVLFNIGGLYTQIGTRQDRSSQEGLDAAVDNFLRAAGTFQFIIENFSHAPSSDLGPECLNTLVQMMLGQARECLLEKAVLALAGDASQMELCLELSQEAAHVSSQYEEAVQAAAPCIPLSWVCLLQVKREHYRALADYFLALPLAADPAVPLTARAADCLAYLHDLSGQPECERPAVPRSRDQRRHLARAHLREALLLHEEGLRLARMCSELRKKEALGEALRQFHQRSLALYSELEEEDDFQEVFSPPPVLPATRFQLSLSYPDFSAHRVVDLFRALGPEAVFSAKHDWTAPRDAQLVRGEDGAGWGFSVRGAAPVLVCNIEQGGIAEQAGVREGDYLVELQGRDVKWSSHEQVVGVVQGAGHSLRLTVVTPLKPWAKHKSVSYATNEGGGPGSSIVRVFTPPSSRTSFSSLSSASSSTSETHTTARQGRKKSWAVLHIKRS